MGGFLVLSVVGIGALLMWRKKRNATSTAPTAEELAANSATASISRMQGAKIELDHEHQRTELDARNNTPMLDGQDTRPSAQGAWELQG